ncbi:protease inhibitor I42 family protein [Methylosinus sporium]|uniref:Protease inhibitor I42 family protein n=2 Tax=Methylocystaceae TaxID=31993 RepID=A0A549T8Y7_METSR|nr:protease inhibitor I42 family protein [Methylosinus sporium]
MRGSCCRGLRMTKLVLIAIAMILLELSSVRAGEAHLTLAKGETRRLELIENPSTGYVWRFDRAASTNPAIVRVVDGGFVPSGDESEPPRAGAPSLRFFRIEAVVAGRARLVFVEERPWEKQAVRRREVEVRVR